MFKRKTKKQKPEVSLYDSNDVLLFRGELNSIPIKEAVVLHKSIEFFNDHDPCYIHRGAVTMRLLGEIENCFRVKLKTSFIVDAQDEDIVNYIDINGIYRMELSKTEEEKNETMFMV